MSVSYYTADYKTFGKVLCITNGDIELAVTLDIGPRIIRCALPGGENFMYEDVNAGIVEKGPAFDRYFYPGAYWRTYGGHRIWLTPEAKPETYYPDNEPCEYSVAGSVFTFVPPAQKGNLVAERLILTVPESGASVEVRAEAVNTSDKPQTFGIWQVSVMCQNGLAVAPQTLRDTHLLHNRRMSLWPYTDMADARVNWGKTLISLKQDPSSDHPFKLGMSNERGYVAYLCHNALFVKSFPYYEGVTYPDDGCNFEMYTNPLFLELESLGKLAPVAPGDTVVNTELWTLTPDVKCPAGSDFAALEAIAGKYIGK